MKANILATRKLSQKEAFYFFTSIGNFTGRSATSLKDFLKEIREVEARSLEFHLQRGDFERWMVDVLGDEKLAGEVEKLGNRKLTGEALRESLCSLVSRRCRDLTRKAARK